MMYVVYLKILCSIDLRKNRQLWIYAPYLYLYSDINARQRRCVFYIYNYTRIPPSISVRQDEHSNLDLGKLQQSYKKINKMIILYYRDSREKNKK